MTPYLAAPAQRRGAQKPVSLGMTLLLAVGCGVTAGNIYYAQPLLGLIAPDIGLSVATAGLVVTFTQIGYCIGLVALAPLGDLLENRALTVATLWAAVVALLAAALAPSAAALLAASLLIGLTSVSIQLLLPIAAHLAPEATRGRTIGNVMSGLLIGVMLSRPVSSLIADALGWRAVFACSAAAMASLAIALRLMLPQRRPTAVAGYFALIGSLGTLLRETPALRRRTAYQGALFAAFCLYWTAVPLELAGPAFGLSQRGIALFALAGASGALAAPLAGRIADRGGGRALTGLSMGVVAIAFLLAWIGGHGSMAALLAAGVALDAGVQGNQVVSQRIVFALGAEARSRLNGLYIAMFFTGGAAGSAVASFAYARGGWSAVSAIGLALPLLALALYATEFLPRRPAGARVTAARD